MQPFANFILSPLTINTRSTDKLGKVLQIEPQAFQQMLTQNGHDRRIANHWLVQASAEKLQQILPSVDVIIATVHVERESIQRINLNGRQLEMLTDEELLTADPTDLIASKAIITLEVRNHNDDFRPTLAINVSPDGEEIAFGSTVDICTNFTILSADRRLSTYNRHQDRSQPRLTIQDMLRQLEGVLQKTEETLDADLEEINRLKVQPVSRKQWHELSGELFSQIHFVNRQRLARNITALSVEEKALPITAAILANIVAEAQRPSHEEYAWDGDMTNRWNLINFGTEMIKLDYGVPSRSWLETSANWSQIIKNRVFS